MSDMPKYHTVRKSAWNEVVEIHHFGHTTRERAESFIGRVNGSKYDKPWTHVAMVTVLDPPKKVEGFLISYIGHDGKVFTFGQDSRPGGVPYDTRDEAVERMNKLAALNRRTAKVIDLSQ